MNIVLSQRAWGLEQGLELQTSLVVTADNKVAFDFPPTEVTIRVS